MENKTPTPQPKSPGKSLTNSFITFKKIIPEKKHGFTLVELIIVIIIVGILAAVGITQYSLMVEKGRTAEAKVRIGTMRQLAYEYYMNNGTVLTMTNADAGVDNTCASTGFYRYYVNFYPSNVTLVAARCTSGGKTPNASRGYYYYLNFNPVTGASTWACQWIDDQSSCFGLQPIWGFYA
ncbi:prepilin-type N-terminal cleavage/methylation domain-containing protein [bacterium]|nr:MAG: prepilin-type N-terminal cleavage/methylation domain-containing protein [bacterium]